MRAQLEAQLDAKADELAAAQRQLAALQQQLLAQRSAGAGAGSAAAAEAEQLRRQLASERQRREQAELAAAHAGQVRECVGMRDYVGQVGGALMGTLFVLGQPRADCCTGVAAHS